MDSKVDTYTLPAPRRRTITLTSRPPVSIDELEWPVIGSARYQDPTSRGQVTVRRHGDGRVLVYARCWGPGHDHHAGELLVCTPDGEQIVRSIQRVHGSIPDPDDGLGWRVLAAQCIASLPVEVL
jgi:hypothetical protein